MNSQNPTHVSYMGNLLTFALFCAPLPTFHDIIFNTNSSENYPVLPYVLILINRLITIIYDLVSHSTTTGNVSASINYIGLAMELAYVMLYLYYSPHNNRKGIWQGICGTFVMFFMIAMLPFVFTNKNDDESREIYCGIVQALSTVSMHAAPMSIVKTVYNTRSVQYLSFTPLLTDTIYASFWTYYQLYLAKENEKDGWVLLSNSISILLGVGLMAFYGTIRWWDGLRRGIDLAYFGMEMALSYLYNRERQHETQESPIAVGDVNERRNQPNVET